MRERGEVVLCDPTSPMGNRDLELDTSGELVLGFKRERPYSNLSTRRGRSASAIVNKLRVCETWTRAPLVRQVSDVISSGTSAVNVDIDSSFGSDVPENCFAHRRATYVAQTDDEDPKRRVLGRRRHIKFKFELKFPLR